MKTLRLTPRRRRILEDLEYRFFATSQIARHHFSETKQPRKKAAETMKQLYDARLVRRFVSPLLEQRGKPEYVYYPAGRHLSRSYRSLAHELAITDFKICFESWAERSCRFTGRLYHPAEIRSRLAAGRLVPDGIFYIESQDKKLLYFLEIDRGTETLRRGRSYALADKLDLYGQYFDSGEYASRSKQHRSIQRISGHYPVPLQSQTQQLLAHL